MSGARNFLFRMFDKPRTIVYGGNSSNTLGVGGNGYAHYISVTAARNVDSINAQRHQVGRKIQIIGHAGNSHNVTIRDNQTGSNIEVVGTSLTVGPGDSVTFRAELDSNGAKVWVQDSALVNV